MRYCIGNDVVGCDDDQHTVPTLFTLNIVSDNMIQYNLETEKLSQFDTVSNLADEFLCLIQ